MADDDAQAHSVQQPLPQEQTTAQDEGRQIETKTVDRASLVEKGRAFLTSGNVRNEDIAAKKRLLAEKGLNEGEVDMLVQQLVCHYSTV